MFLMIICIAFCSFALIDLEWSELQALEGRLGGLRDIGESIVLSLVELKDAYKAAPDAKLLSALALFHALKAEGKIE